MPSAAATDKLYLEDSYTASFEAELVSCETGADGRRLAVLDRTYFYPESGGQQPDRGDIDGVEVVDVREDEHGTVFHEVSREIPPGRVRGEVNWNRRFDHMQQHTGQHVLSRAFIETANLETVSFHMGDQTCTIDVAGAAPASDVCRAAESLANEIVWDDRPVAVRTLARDEVREIALRKKIPEGVEEVRLVEVEGFDIIGCCGTHVRRTGELGVIKILKFEKVKSAHRIHFKVGKRALADFATKHDIVQRLANRLTTSVGQLDEKVAKLEHDARSARKDIQRLSKRLVEFEAARLLDGATEMPGGRFIVEFLEDGDEYARALAGALKSVSGTVVVLGTPGGTVLCNASDDVDVDFMPVVARAKAAGGRGGGKGRIANVRLPEGASVRDFLEGVREEIQAGGGRS